MRVWLVTVGEPLPLTTNQDRLWRTGLLARLLARRGHDVLWWTSTVDHFRKEFLFAEERRIDIGEGLAIQFLHGRLYRRNVSLRRLANHAEIGARFAALAPAEPRPDVILCSFPTIELSAAAVRFGNQAGVPVILDVRDLWPDIFLDVLPGMLRPLGRFLLKRLFADSRDALQGCYAIFAVSDNYLAWGRSHGKRSASVRDKVYPLAYQMSCYTAEDSRALDERLSAAGLSMGGPLLLFAGTFGRTYDLRTVIEAARIMGPYSSGAQFVLCGSGERDAEWKKAAAGVSGVGFVGWLPAGQLACLLARSTVGLAAYAAGAPQGVPNKVIEYLAAGLPVLCSLAGESRVLLESHRCGIYYEAGDPQSLAQAITGVLADEMQRKQMAVAARQLFEQRFSAAQVYEVMADHLEQLAARSDHSGK